MQVEAKGVIVFMKRLKLLFLSAEVGAGHTRTAQAICKVLPQSVLEPEVQIVDFFHYLNPIMRKALVNGYMEMIKTTPAIYRYLYDRAEERESLLDFNKLLNIASKIKLKKLFNEFNPDIIASTHAFPSGVLSVLKDKGKIKNPIITIITDFTAHPFWIYPNMDAYLVATEEIANLLINRGIPQKRVHITGIPIDPIFMELPSKIEVRKKLNLDQSLFTILIAGGGLGLGPLESIVSQLAVAKLPIQLIVMVGKNKILKEKLEQVVCFSKTPIKIVGYTNNVHELMASSDLLISKPGGLTCAEALSIGLPMVIAEPIPGQEERNSKFIVQSGVGIKLEDSKMVNHLVENFLNNPYKLVQMKENALKLAKPEAAISACKLLKKIYLLDGGG